MTIEPDKMCFGLDEKLDKESFACFLQLAGEKKFAEILSERVNSQEILNFVDSFTALLRKYLSEDEYHKLFLQDTFHHHPQSGKD